MESHPKGSFGGTGADSCHCNSVTVCTGCLNVHGEATDGGKAAVRAMVGWLSSAATSRMKIKWICRVLACFTEGKNSCELVVH